MNRRKFTQVVFFGFLCLYFAKVSFAEDSTINYPFKTLPEAFRVLGFDPTIKGNSFFVVTADVHYGIGEDGMLPTIQEVNQMNPLPAFFCVDGDMILNGSRHFGAIPDANGLQAANHEFNEFKAHADLLNPQIPLLLVLGNHDTHPKEIEPAMFWEVFPDRPPYQSFDIEGVHILSLNGHNTGYIDPIQMKWLLDDISHIPSKQTVIIFVHQPSISRRVRERGLPEAVSEAFKNHHGLVWLIGGHEHWNRQKIFQLKNTQLIEHQITCGSNKIWGGPEHPGYWIYCIRKGQVIGRIFKQQFKGYRLEPEPDLNLTEKIPTPFDHINHYLWKLMVGEGDRNFLIESKAADCLNYWAYVKELVYRIPLKYAGNRGKTIAMLTDHKLQNLQQEGQYFLSSDLINWQEIKLKNANYDVLQFSIPSTFINLENIYFKFTPSGVAAVAGFALLQ